MSERMGMTLKAGREPMAMLAGALVVRLYWISAGNARTTQRAYVSVLPCGQSTRDLLADRVRRLMCAALVRWHH
jgi:hypothetical protein